MPDYNAPPTPEDIAADPRNADPTYWAQTPARMGTPTGAGPATTPSPGSNGTPGSTTLTPQQYVEAWRQQHPNFSLKQADPASGWDQLVKDMNAVGFKTTLDSRPDGMHKGIMLDGGFVKLADGNDNAIWMPGGDTRAGSAGGPLAGGVDPSYLKPFEMSFGDFNPAYVDKAKLGTPPEFSFDPFTAPTEESMQQDPGFKFRMDTGRGMVENSAAGKGVLNSGGTLYDLLKTGQQMGSQEYSNIWNRDFNLWGANNQNKLNAYGTNYGVGTDAYNRAQNQFGEMRNTYFQNQNSPFQKLFQVAGLGANAAAG